MLQAKYLLQSPRTSTAPLRGCSKTQTTVADTLLATSRRATRTLLLSLWHMQLTALQDWHSQRERMGGKGVIGRLREAVKGWWNLSGLKMRIMKEKMRAQLKKQERS